MKRFYQNRSSFGILVLPYFALPLLGLFNVAAKWAETSERIQGIFEGIFIGYVLALMILNVVFLFLRGQK